MQVHAKRYVLDTYARWECLAKCFKICHFFGIRKPQTRSLFSFLSTLDFMSIVLPFLSWYLIFINIVKKINNHMNYAFIFSVKSFSRKFSWNFVSRKNFIACNLTTVWTPKRRCWLVVCCFCCEWWDTYLGLCVQCAIIYFQASFHQKVAENATRWLLNNRNDLYM